jgi:two-component system sensor histidine kinase KdpD
MSAVRPDPDALLARVQREEQKAKRGKLTVFFGATGGRRQDLHHARGRAQPAAKGVDVVVGYVEPHGRAETEALLHGLEQINYLEVKYRGRTLRDFDLDAALARKPEVLLVDELAHSNPVEGEPRPRHAKRWQDIEELLEAGINVYTTVNVQHIESLNDIVAGITGVRMQETVPDAVFEKADEVVLIDTPPDELLARLHAGKVYIPEQARNAIENFFRKGNLIALRELALRTTAERVDRAMEEYRTGEGIRAIWAAGERLLVAIGPDEQGERLVRAGKRMAVALHAEVDRRLRRDTGPAAHVRREARRAHRAAAPRRIARRRGGHAFRTLRRGSARRICARAQRQPHRHRPAAPPAVAATVPPIDVRRVARQRRRHRRARRRRSR